MNTWALDKIKLRPILERSLIGYQQLAIRIVSKYQPKWVAIKMITNEDKSQKQSGKLTAMPDTVEELLQIVR